jgi:predicted nucleic acid-binding Zn ribbon protein
LTDSYDELDFANAADLVGKRRRYFRRPKKPANLLGQLMARTGFSQQQSQTDLADVWKTLVGEQLNNKTRVGQLKRNVLEVFVSSSAVNQQLSFKKAQLVQQLQQKLPKEKIKNIRFKIGSFG